MPWMWEVNVMHPFERIADQYRRAILSGDLRPGERLRSVKDLAEEHGVSSTTVRHALSQLQVEKLVHTSPRGTFVTDDPHTGLSARDRLMHTHVPTTGPRRGRVCHTCSSCGRPRTWCDRQRRDLDFGLGNGWAKLQELPQVFTRQVSRKNATTASEYVERFNQLPREQHGRLPNRAT
jgi:DNA-binding transcriptional regulator YhcF (GntR family)